MPNLILIGLRGSGKSTIGRLAAARLGRAFVDLDDLTPRELGCSGVADAWARFGEAAFRTAEIAALKKVLALTDHVIALGGERQMQPGGVIRRAPEAGLTGAEQRSVQRGNRRRHGRGL